jgi:hypothetical protein
MEIARLFQTEPPTHTFEPLKTTRNTFGSADLHAPPFPFNVGTEDCISITTSSPLRSKIRRAAVIRIVAVSSSVSASFRVRIVRRFSRG